MWAAEMVPQDLEVAPGFVFTVPGVITNSEFTGQGFSNGQPYIARPATMTGWYKAEVATDDTCTIVVEFFETGTVIEEQTVEITATASAWTQFTMTFNVPVNPDTMRIQCTSGDVEGTIFTVDNFQFAGGDLGTDEANNLTFTAYPNPSTDFC